MAERPPLCINCRHCYIPVSFTPAFFTVKQVKRPELARCALTDMVDGSGRAGVACVVERSAVSPCGHAGRNFEEKRHG